MAQLTNQATPSPTPDPNAPLADSATPTPHPAAVALANNLSALANGGHTYLGVPAMVAIASGGQSVPQTLQIAQTIKDSIQSNKAIVGSFYSDPAQNTQPTLNQQIAAQLHSIVGGKAVMDTNVADIQKQMQAAGVGKGLPVDNIWSTEWQTALSDSYQASLKKPGIGNAPPESTISHILHFMNTTPVINFLFHTAKALPRETLQAMGGLYYGMVSGGSDPSGGKAIAQLGAKPENRTSTQQFEQTAVSPAQQIQDFGTLLQYIPAAKLVAGVASHVIEARIATDIAKNTVKKTAVEKVLGSNRFTALQHLDNVAPKYTLLNSIVRSAQAGTPGLMDLSDSAILSRPVLRWVFPQIASKLSGAIASTAPIQMTIRNFLAQRLRLPIVQAANSIGLSGLGAALKFGTIAVGESKLGGRQGTFDSTVYSPGPIAGALGTALNIWGMQMNPGRVGAAQILDHTGQAAQILRDTFSDTGAIHAFVNANPQFDYAGEIAKYGVAAVNQEIGHQLNQIAVNHATDIILRPIKADPNGWASMTDDQKQTLWQDTSKQVWRDSAPAGSALNLSYQHIITDMNAMETGFRNQGLSAVEDVRTTANAPGVSTFGQKVTADQALQELLKPENQKYLVHPGTLTTLAEQQKAFHDSQMLAESDALHEPVAPDAIPTPDPQILESTKADYQAKLDASNAAEANFKTVQAKFNKPLVSQSDINRANRVLTKTRQTLQESAEADRPKALKDFQTRQNILDNLKKEFKEQVPTKKADLNHAKVAWTTARQDLGQSVKSVSQAQKDVSDATKANTQRIRANAGVPNSARPSKTAGWVEAHNPAAPDGMIGLMRKKGLASQDNTNLVAKFNAQLEDAGKDPVKLEKVRHDVGQALIGHHGIDIYTLGDHSTSALIDILDGETSKLASNIYPVIDAPQHIKDLLKIIDDNNFKPVAGTDVGHVYTKSLFRDLGSDYQKSNASKVATKIGLSPRASDSAAVSARTEVETLREIQSRIDDGRINALPGFNASRIKTFLKNNLSDTAKLTLGQRGALGFGHIMGNYDLKIAQLMKETPSLTSEEAWAKIQVSKKTELGLREIKPKQLRAALTKEIPAETASLMGLEPHTPFLDTDSANQVIQALWKGRLNVPSEMIGGLAKAEDWLYAGLGVGDKTFLGVNGMKLAELPARAFNLRSRVRYQESIVFAYRRMFKTAAKGITENIPPTMYPEAKMAEMGITAQADKIYQRVFPEEAEKNAYLDDTQRLVSEGDLYNLYSPRDSVRWAAYWLEKQGFTDAQIKQKISNIIDYGQTTAAEHSLNAVFFPFSFNKTVIRQFGGFLMTHPGQRMILSTLMDQYDKHGGPDMLKWMEDHAPLIKEFEKLNAFEHGIGLGQAGGINAPYFEGLIKFLNIMGAKKIDYGTSSKNEQTIKTLGAYIPMLQEFTSLFITNTGSKVGIQGELGSTIGNAWDGATAAIEKYVMHTTDTDWSPIRHTSMGYTLQQNEAWAYRSRMITMLSQVLDYNYKNPNSRKVWPNWVPQVTGLWGKPITKSSIGELVHYKYPAWDNAASAVIAQQKATETDRFIGAVSVKDPTLGAAYRVFDTKAKAVSDAVGRDTVKPDKLAAITQEFRTVAVQLALKDPNFKDFYKTHYQRIFGPLEVFSQ